MTKLDGKQFALQLAQRGGPGRRQVASDEHRQNNYKDVDGQYQLATGLKPWHERIVDVMISQPHAKVKDLAEFFNVSPQWMGQVIKTDAFKSYYQMRMTSHQDHVGTKIINKMQAVATKALDKLDEALDKEVTIGQVRETADLALKGLGYTQSKGGGVNVAVKGNGQTTVQVAVPSNVLERARQKWVDNMNSADVEIDLDNYSHVTATDTPKAAEIEDAVLLDESTNQDETSQGI